MITKYKLFENLNQGLPEVGDYILLKPKNTYVIVDLNNFLINTIGRIDNIKKNIYPSVDISYENIPKLFSRYFLLNGQSTYIKRFSFDEIEYWSKNKEDLETVLQTNKYNI